jgi:hypothetical protein
MRQELRGVAQHRGLFDFGAVYRDSDALRCPVQSGRPFLFTKEVDGRKYIQVTVRFEDGTSSTAVAFVG